MDDKTIVGLFWERDQEAVAAAEKKYGSYCLAIAGRILGDPEDAREAVNDAYLGAWNSIPPQRPAVLSAYLGKLTRRIALNRWQERRAQKRGGGETALALEELGDCVPGGDSVEQAVEQTRLEETLRGFVSRLPETERKLFVCRYWYLDPIADIARRFGYSESKVKTTLCRTRKKLRKHLEKEGFFDET